MAASTMLFEWQRRSPPALKVAQPPSTVALLHASKPAACGIERDHHQEPDRVNSRKAIAIAGGLVRQVSTQEPAHLPGRPPCSRQRQHMDEIEVRDVVEERHASEGGDDIGKSPAHALEGSE